MNPKASGAIASDQRGGKCKQLALTRLLRLPEARRLLPGDKLDAVEDTYLIGMYGALRSNDRRKPQRSSKLRQAAVGGQVDARGEAALVRGQEQD